jgi:tetratricopeptide (TPR) repeat protein
MTNQSRKDAPMNLLDCYRILGLTPEAKLEDIKASYRRLARLYHPDVNPGSTEAQAKFVQLNQAYQLVLKTAQAVTPKPKSPTAAPPQPQRARVTTQPTQTPPTVEFVDLSPAEKQLKWNAYGRLQNMLQERRLVSAIALVDGLAHRLPQDPEVRQWQGIAYQQRGRELIEKGEVEKGRIYLKKALKADPHNRALWSEVKRDFQRIERNWHMPLGL